MHEFDECSTAKSGLSATSGTAGLIFNASWGLGGTAKAAATITSIGGYAGTVLGGLSAGIGTANMVIAGTRRAKTTKVEQQLKAARQQSANEKYARENNILNEDALNGKNREQIAKEESLTEGKRQILQNVINANRSTQKRAQASAAVQMVQGGLNTAAGVLTLSAGATLGVTGIVALGLSGISLLIGIGNVIRQKKAKSQSVIDVIDCYVDMDNLYQDFMKKHKGNRKAGEEKVRKQFGNKEAIREMLRKEAEATLGFPSHKKMFSAIMWKYTNTLYDAVFKKNGVVLTEQRKNTELERDPAAGKERKLFADMLRAYGFKIKYPVKAGDEPKPGLNSIYKKITA